MQLSAAEYLHHILDEADYLLEYSASLSKEAFLEDETLKRAFVRSLSVIGEASKKLPEEIIRRFEYIQWREMAGMRDRLIHGYFGTDYDIVWDVVTNKIPDLQKQIDEILQELD